LIREQKDRTSYEKKDPITFTVLSKGEHEQTKKQSVIEVDVDGV